MVLNLKRKLMLWVEKGLITADQQEKILGFESEGGSRPWVVYGIAGIGVSTLITGIISTIAANWDSIPHWFKLLNYFLIQSLVGWGFIRFEKKPGVWREVLLSAFMLLFFSGIGLIAQIYNLRGDGWQALLLWLIITLPLVLQARNWPICHLWVVVTLIASGIWASSRTVFYLPEFGRVCVFAAVPLILTTIGFLDQKFPKFNESFKFATLIWGLGFALLVSTPVANAFWSSAYRNRYNEEIVYLVFPWIALFCAIAASWVRPGVSRNQKLATAATLLAGGIYISLPLFILRTQNDQKLFHQLLGAAGFIAVWACAATAAALAHYRRLFDVASLIIAGRFIVIYFEVFGSLANTGLGLIISGLVILGIAFFWNRSRKNIRVWIGGGK